MPPPSDANSCKSSTILRISKFSLVAPQLRFLDRGLIHSPQLFVASKQRTEVMVAWLWRCAETGSWVRMLTSFLAVFSMAWIVFRLLSHRPPAACCCYSLPSNMQRKKDSFPGGQEVLVSLDGINYGVHRLPPNPAHGHLLQQVLAWVKCWS